MRPNFNGGTGLLRASNVTQDKCMVNNEGISCCL